MIKANGMIVKLEGRAEELCAELSVIVASMNEALTAKFDEEMAEDLIMKAFAVGFMSDEEFDAECAKLDEKVKETDREIYDLLGKLADALSRKEKKDGSEQ